MTNSSIGTNLTGLAALVLCLLPHSVSAHDQAADIEDNATWSIAIHGGAGTMDRDKMTMEQQVDYKAALQAALDAGTEVLRNGGTAMDAVKAAIVPMEDDPKFNAGRGAVFTWEGANELDAALMDGATRKAGAVAGVKAIKNPILLADAVMQDGRHVFLSGAGAEEFAAGAGLETAGPEWFATDARREAIERMKAEQLSAVDVDYKFGTVGAVVMDQYGNLAAGTSTGGLTGKRWGRIGDVPVIGAGTYADNRSCAVSATGAGEYFIRVGVAQEICTRLRYRFAAEIEAAQASVPLDTEGFPTYVVHGSEFGLSEGQVREEVDAVMDEVKELGGTGGVIVVTPEGHAVFSFNTSGMYRGRATSSGMNEVAIFTGE
ncbi:isoaspartyl peptidase/L-asparaginase [Pontixanthobacter gangjinensis]|uniref:Isoaspartyl peptidase/L-asparaginase n=2 Tax=Pontixanthobacter gangjinensis TaxID=1028742 RepID=A0A6I4SMY0_9SPHN|nr:isoaspartyl peptidase/L-asparaginase [Pontixanthobacter gangjinensis]MXO56102.1 isoaspartyl peptidase/L-asparaginase [Pontixanthobacter gangjinensis]